MEENAERIKHLADKIRPLFLANDHNVSVLIKQVTRLLDQIPMQEILVDTLQMHELGVITQVLEAADRILQQVPLSATQFARLEELTTNLLQYFHLDRFQVLIRDDG